MIQDAAAETRTNARRVILSALSHRYRQRFRDPWDFVRFAQERRLGLDFTCGPKRRLTGRLVAPER